VSDIPSEIGGGAAKAAVPPASLGRAGRILGIIAGAMIMGMMVVTTVDVIGRDVFNRPLLGAFEVTEILMGLVIFAGMPLATAARFVRASRSNRRDLRRHRRGHGVAHVRARLRIDRRE